MQRTVILVAYNVIQLEKLAQKGSTKFNLFLIFKTEGKILIFAKIHYGPLKIGKKSFRKHFKWNFVLRFRKKVFYPFHFNKYFSKRSSFLCEKYRLIGLQLAQFSAWQDNFFFRVSTRQKLCPTYTRCVRKVSDLRSYLRVGAILRHPDRGTLRNSPHLIEPHAPSDASTS